jgi:hypothetical protein
MGFIGRPIADHISSCIPIRRPFPHLSKSLVERFQDSNHLSRDCQVKPDALFFLLEAEVVPREARNRVGRKCAALDERLPGSARRAEPPYPPGRNGAVPLGRQMNTWFGAKNGAGVASALSIRVEPSPLFRFECWLWRAFGAPLMGQLMPRIQASR